MPIPLPVHINEENREGWLQVRYDNNEHRKKIKKKMYLTERLSVSFIIRDIPNKTTGRYHFTWQKFCQESDHTKRWQECGVTVTPVHCWWEC